MGHLYYVRHGQTVWNVEDKICGSTDSPLTDYGRQQAREAAEKIRAEGISFDEILYSPLSRAKDTALIISELTGVPAREEKRLFEQNFGKWEGTSPRRSPEFTEAKRSFVSSYEGGESMLKFCHRVYGLLDEITSDSSKTFLLVAHNGVSRVVHSYFNDMTNDEYAQFGIKNCEICEYCWEDSQDVKK
ncbi:MAG: histidine phosphatase family protein [Treponema sp.]|nr:histidine phosphatase family protein [Treponema sp.]